MFSVVFYSCTDLAVIATDSEFIELEGGAITADPADLLATNYNDLGSVTDQANIYSLSAHSSDEMIPPTRGVDWGDNGVWRTLHAHTWDPAHSYVLGAWNQLNERVFRCNRTLAASPDASQEAQARFLRAWYMHQVMDLFGVAPFRNVTDGVDVNPQVFTRTEAFNFIMDDLTAALPNLPVGGPAFDNTTATTAACNYLIAKMHLNRAVYTAGDPAGPYTFDGADMDAVIAAVDAITGDGYSLEADFYDLFNAAGNTETILASPTGSGNNRVRMTLHYSQNPSGWNGFTTLSDFYDKFDDGDIRKGLDATPDGSAFSGIGLGLLFGQQYNDDGTETIDSRTSLPLFFTRDVPLAGAGTDKGIRVMKYHPATVDNSKYVLMRYADAYLMKAEALMRKGETAQAMMMVNDLRDLRGAPDLASLDEAAMLDERGRELYWEGYRRTDLVRFSKFNDAWQEKPASESYRVLFPIPALALASNPNLTQNPGY